MWDILLPLNARVLYGYMYQLEFRAQVADLGLASAGNAGLENDSCSNQWTNEKKKRYYPSIYTWFCHFSIFPCVQRVQFTWKCEKLPAFTVR